MHIPVLSNEVIDGLDLHDGEVLVDATFGLGGHSKLACAKIPNLKIIAIDLNKDTLMSACRELKKEGCSIVAEVENFRNLDRVLDKNNIENANKYIFDLGWSSAELEESGRGFSFKRDEPLLMTYKANLSDGDLTAKEIVNNWQEENIRAILSGYSNERYAKEIAEKVVEARRSKKINTTIELVNIIASAVPEGYKKSKIHFATKTFQALRITTNDEIESLKEALAKAFERLSIGGRIAVISFHSTEDRIVKNHFRNLYKEKRLRLINKNVVVAKYFEVKQNPRSRSAKLRVIEKV